MGVSHYFNYRGFVTKLHSVVRLQFWRSNDSGILLLLLLLLPGLLLPGLIVSVRVLSMSQIDLF